MRNEYPMLVKIISKHNDEWLLLTQWNNDRQTFDG